MPSPRRPHSLDPARLRFRRQSSSARQNGGQLVQVLRQLSQHLGQNQSAPSQNPPQNRKRLSRLRRSIFPLSLLAVFSLILLLALVPGSQRFEAQVVATAIHFQVDLPANQPRQRLLDSIRNVAAVDLIGAQSTPLVLSGQLTAPDLETQSELTIELPYDTSRIRFEPILPAPTEGETTVPEPDIEVLALQLQDQAVVETLGYAPATNQLELRFRHEQPPVLNQGSELQIYLGNYPLSITIEGYRLPQLNRDDPDGNQPITFTFEPNIWELARPLPTTGTLYLELPPLAEKDTLRWFWGDIPATDVDFTREEFRQGDSLERSTIRSGLVRLGDQSLDIEADQFFLTQGPGIQRLRQFQLDVEEGIAVQAIGEASQVQVGLAPDFPVQTLDSNILARWFRRDIMVAIVSFSGAMVASLLSWLVDNLFQAAE